MGGGVPNTRERARQPASRRELLFAFLLLFCFSKLVSFCELGKGFLKEWLASRARALDR